MRYNIYHQIIFFSQQKAPQPIKFDCGAYICQTMFTTALRYIATIQLRADWHIVT